MKQLSILLLAMISCCLLLAKDNNAYTNYYYFSNMTADQYKTYWLKKYEETKSTILSDKKRSQAYRDLLLAQNDQLCSLTLSRVSGYLAQAFVQNVADYLPVLARQNGLQI